MNPQFEESLAETVTTIGTAIPATAIQDLLVGTVIAQKYEILEPLGKGGMSIVYKARHIGMDKVLALKVLHMHLSQDEQSRRRFKQEAQAASNLTHPGIVAVYDCGSADDGVPYLVMDYVEGESLSELLKKTGPLHLAPFLLIMQQVSSALAYAHEHGVVHRDLKPSNIMVSQSAGKIQAKIVDFGIAKLMSQENETSQGLTQTGEVFGSPLYMSPEQCSGTAIDERSDIYSLGCVMYEALCGSTPFKGGTIIETIHKHVNTPPPPLVAEQIPEEARQKLEVLLLRSLAKLPQDRQQGMSKVESELRMISLKSKTNLIAALGGVWDLAAAKQRAARKSKIPLMVIALVSVSIFSSASIITLQMTLQESYREIARLEQSRNLVNEINLTQQSFLSMENAARLYFAALILFPSRIPERKKTFEFTGEALVGRLNRVEKATSSNKDWIRKFHKGKLRLISILEATKTSARTLEVQPTHSDMEMGMSMMNPANLRVSIQLSMMASEGINILQAMSHEGMKVEAEQHGQFKETTKWIRFLSPLSTILSGTLLLALVAYFAKGSPQSLRNMASKAALLRKQGLVSSSVSKDEVADLNKVFEELAQALNDAEEREKALLKQLQEQDRPNHE